VPTQDWFDAGGTGSPADLSDLLDNLVLDALVRIVGAGALVSAGLTSDGGALGVTITLDGRWRREYFRTGAELAQWLSDAEAAVMAASSGGRTPRQEVPRAARRGRRAAGGGR
jgi:hypothetical protein